MKKKYPRYKPGRLGVIKSRLKPKDKKILNDFLAYCGTTAGQKKLKNIERAMLQIHDVMQKPYWNITLKDLREFLGVLNKCDRLEATKNDIKKVLKRFLKEQYPDWNTRFAQLKDIKTKKDWNQDKLNANTILTAKELETLIRKAESLRLKALIMLMFESGGRPEEIMKLRWSDIDLETGEVKLHSSKTGNIRVNPLKESIIHLKRYKQEYPHPDQQARDFVFPAVRNRNKHMSVAHLDFYFKDLGKRAIGRHIFPYLLRHTRATQLQKELPSRIYEKFMDHSMEMAKRYSHLNKNDVREVMLEKIYHIEEVSEKERDEIGRLRNELGKLKKQVARHFMGKDFVKLLMALSENQRKLSKAIQETTGRRFDVILPSLRLKRASRNAYEN